METPKHCTQEKPDKLSIAVPWLLVFPTESSPNYLCIALGQESSEMLSKLLTPILLSGGGPGARSFRYGEKLRSYVLLALNDTDPMATKQTVAMAKFHQP